MFTLAKYKRGTNMKRQKLRKALVLISFLFFPITLYYFSPYLIIQGAFEGIVTGSFIVFTLMFLVSLFLGRAFCGWVCPAGGLQECCTLAVDKKARTPFMIIGTKLKNVLKYPSLHLKVNKDKCISCSSCTKKCPMSLEVMDMVHSETMANSECILCGEYVDICPKSVIKYSIKD